MKSLKKRMLTTALAGAMALSLAAPAFAAGANTETLITGSYAAATIDVTVPTTGTVSINPYGIPVEIKKSDNTKLGTVKGQIVGQPLALCNNSDMDVRVGVTVTGEAVGNLKFSTTTNAESETPGNNAFVYLQSTAATTTKDKTSKSADANALQDAISTDFVAWSASDYSEDTDIVVGTKAVEKTDFAELKASTVGDDSGTPFATYKDGSVLMFRLAGDLSPVVKTAWVAPDPGATPAVEGDGFKVTLAFTFSPM